MGNLLNKDHEESAIREINSLSSNAKLWLGHHVRNELCKIYLLCDCDLLEEDRDKIADRIVDHFRGDLKKIGC